MIKIVTCVILIFLFFNASSQLSLSFLNVSTTLTVARASATYSFSGTGTDTIGVYLVDQSYYVVKTLRSNFIVSQGVYQDSILLDTEPDGSYNFVLTHGTKIFGAKRIIKSVLASIEDLPLSSFFSIYPNPVKDKLQLHFESGNTFIRKLLISNSLGELVYTSNDLKTEQEIELDFLAQGIYYLKIETNEGIKTVKFVKE